MDARSFLQKLRQQSFFVEQIVHSEKLPERTAIYANLSCGLPEPLEKALCRLGIERLYSHQVTAIDRIRDGDNVVIVTSTASGKTFCYTIPIVETWLKSRETTAVCIYPTKALAQDQLRGFNAFQFSDIDIPFSAATYDGDTPTHLRRRVRETTSILLTNPDMLHQSILPHHARWNRFFALLRYIVIDEVHAYRGIFGSHLANVLRRMIRICEHYGSAPQFICSSATIANPKEHAEIICGAPMELVDNDGAPHGTKYFVLWNPPALKSETSGKDHDCQTGGARRNPVAEAVELMTHMVKEGIQTITFSRTRLAAELILKNCREMLSPMSCGLANFVQAYRGGYLPEERRTIQSKLVNKELLGISSTNALELGIDIGSLDACILVGYPGTIASLWQQAGRAGRGTEQSIIFLIARNTPMDQYLMANTDYLFVQSPEQAIIDPDNPHISVGHLKCASSELPLNSSKLDVFGPYSESVLELLEEHGDVRHIGDNWYWASTEYPAAQVNLRNITGEVYTIQDDTETGRVIGTMDAISALSQLHTHAVYVHGAETFFVQRLDLEQNTAFVQRRKLDYYTQSVQNTQIQIDDTVLTKEIHSGLLAYGDVTVTTAISMFKKIAFDSRENMGFEKLDLPAQLLETVAFWFSPSQTIVRKMAENNLPTSEALLGIANVLVEVVPLFVMCDNADVGIAVDRNSLGREAIFLHDRCPGGMGYARRCLESFHQIMNTVRDVITHCVCSVGCPSCVGHGGTSSGMNNLDNGNHGTTPNKEGAKFLMERLQA